MIHWGGIVMDGGRDYDGCWWDYDAAMDGRDYDGVIGDDIGVLMEWCDAWWW